MAGRREFYLEGLSVHRVIDKLAGAGIPVLSARRVQKKGLCLEVDGKDYKKAFAILRGSCYNVKKVRPRGISRLLDGLKRRAGLLLGALLFLLLSAFMQTRVLAVRVEGSGAYLAAQVEDILSRGGVKKFSAPPAEYAPLRAAVLSLPRVSFCSFSRAGGVLTVTVETEEESAPLRGSLRAPADGVICELVVVRGTPLFAEGDEVKTGEEVVAGYTLEGEARREVVVIAQVKVKFPFAAEYVADEAGARAQALLDYGEIEIEQTTKTEKGWLVAGTAYAAAAVNLG